MIDHLRDLRWWAYWRLWSLRRGRIRCAVFGHDRMPGGRRCRRGNHIATRADARYRLDADRAPSAAQEETSWA